jgi:hypothetical protein
MILRCPCGGTVNQPDRRWHPRLSTLLTAGHTQAGPPMADQVHRQARRRQESEGLLRGWSNRVGPLLAADQVGRRLRGHRSLADSEEARRPTEPLEHTARNILLVTLAFWEYASCHCRGILSYLCRCCFALRIQKQEATEVSSVGLALRRRCLCSWRSISVPASNFAIGGSRIVTSPAGRRCD